MTLASPLEEHKLRSYTVGTSEQSLLAVYKQSSPFHYASSLQASET